MNDSEHTSLDEEDKKRLNKWTKNEVDRGDMFRINPYDYFLVEEVTDTSVSGFMRDGVYVVGDSSTAEMSMKKVLSNLNEDEDSWEYQGNFTQLLPDK